ncbi:MAG: hypothetical protein COW65_18440 [Cytophagales bacterium CG18_big_fil_WC_8_21_14_2_50_42_9]|nr:MAG: hypothetical protein COW65_18440 [Cytophagales bacterium CG18_big_fil_WC_8_21_14_2_50_42_9]
METFISVLRGINVSGQKKIRMADLKALYAALGFQQVTTYIQSGNVVFKTNSELSNQDLAKEIERAIQLKYNFAVPVIIRRATELTQVIANNPFLQDSAIASEKLHVTFLAEIPLESNLEKLKTYNFPPDQFVIIGREVFLYIPERYGDTKLSNSFLENKLKVAATTRNWKTVQQLNLMASLLLPE